MAKALVVVESPAKAKTINKYLGKDYKVVASMGHVRDLPKSKLGVDVDEGFEPSYEVIASRKKVVTELKAAAKEASEIFVATCMSAGCLVAIKLLTRPSVPLPTARRP